MRYNSEHKKSTRVRVLNAAAKAIRLSGPDRIGVSSVMTEVGLTHGGFYAHFSSKDELVVEAVKHSCEQARALFCRKTEDREPAEALRSFITFYLSREHRDDRVAGCPIATLSSDMPRMGKSSRAVYAATVQGLRHGVCELLKQLGHVDADALAYSMIAELIGALALARVELDEERSIAVLDASKASLFQSMNLKVTNT